MVWGIGIIVWYRDTRQWLIVGKSVRSFESTSPFEPIEFALIKNARASQSGREVKRRDVQYSLSAIHVLIV